MNKRDQTSQAPKMSIMLFLVTFFMTLFSVISANVTTINLRKAFVGYDEFPVGFSMLEEVSSDSYETAYRSFFSHFPHWTVKEEVLGSNRVLASPKLTFHVYGLSEKEHPPFIPCPIKNDALVPLNLQYGSSLAHDDYILGSTSFLAMDSVVSRGINANSNTLVIDGKAFTMRGVYKECNASKRSSGGADVAIFVSEATFDSLFPESSYPHTRVMIGKTDDFDYVHGDEIGYQSYIRIQEKEKQELKLGEDNQLALIGAMIIASSFGIAIVQMLYAKSREQEIGIRRAIGASKVDILLEFGKKSFSQGLVGIMAGFIVGISGALLYGTFVSISLNSDLVVLSWPLTIAIVGIYGLVFVLTFLAPTLVINRISISCVLMEER